MSALIDRVPADIDDELGRQWAGFGEPGTWLTGEQRASAVDAVRTGTAQSRPHDPTTIEDVARLVGHHAATITKDTVDAVEAAGIDQGTYVEIVGIASRQSAIDSFDRGVGRDPRPLPAVVGGKPNHEVATDAKQRSGWVAAVGPIGPPNALSSVPRESADQERLCNVLYLSYTGMADLDAHRGLHRTQMELVAARVSLLNDCFF